MQVSWIWGVAIFAGLVLLYLHGIEKRLERIEKIATDWARLTDLTASLREKREAERDDLAHRIASMK